MDPRTGLDGCGKSCPYWDSIPGPSSPQRVAIPTELSRSEFHSTSVIKEFLFILQLPPRIMGENLQTVLDNILSIEFVLRLVAMLS